MANVIYTIPDHLLDLAYHAWYGSPNSDLFTRNQLQRKPIPPLGLDNLALWTSDALQDLAETLAGINREKIGVEGQKLQLLYFSDDGILQAISLQDLINSLLAPLALDGSNIGEETIYGASLRKNTLKKDHYGLQSIETEAIKDLAVTNAKIQPVPLSKTRSSGNVSLVIGQKDGSHYTELSYMGAPKLVLPAVGDDGILKFYNLSSIWYYSPVEYEGSKLRNLTTPLAKLLSSNKNTILVGKTDTSVGELDCNKGVLSVAQNSGVPSFTPIADVINNDPQATGKINGNNLLPNSVDFGAINPTNNPLGNVKFFDAGYYSNNQAGNFYLFKSFTAVRSGVGLYDFTINTGYRTDYFIVSVAFADNSFRYYVTQTTKYSFRVTVTGGEAPFSIMIIGYQ